MARLEGTCEVHKVRPVRLRAGQVDNSLAIGRQPAVAQSVAVARAADGQEHFGREQEHVVIGCETVEPHAEIDVVDRPPERSGQELEAKVDLRKGRLEAVEAWHQPMCGERRRNGQGHALATALSPGDLLERPLNATETFGNAFEQDGTVLGQWSAP